MSLDDFERCTPSEFYKIYEVWNQTRESKEHSAWERARIICVSVLSPYSEKKIRPKDVMVFPWERQSEGKEEFDVEDERRRYEAALRRYGIDGS